MAILWRMPSRHKSLLTLEKVEVEETLKEEEVEVEEDLNEGEVGTLEEAKANKASRAKDQRRAKVNLKMKGMTNLMLNVITIKSMVIMLESVKRSKETMASLMQTTL